MTEWANITREIQRITTLQDHVKDDHVYESQTFGEPTEHSLDKLSKTLEPFGADMNFVDIGSGFGRLAMFIKFMHPKWDVTALEVNSHRHDHAQDINSKYDVGVKCLCVNGLDYDYSNTTVVYCYDYAFLSETRQALAVKLRRHKIFLLVTAKYASAYINEGFVDTGWKIILQMRGQESHVFKFLAHPSLNEKDWRIFNVK